jgi:hypothetical protein
MSKKKNALVVASTAATVRLSGQYTKLPAELTASPVLRNLPQRAYCIILAIITELNRNRGKNNGRLVVPYSQLEFWLGTSDPTAISLAIKQARAFGLIVVVEGCVRKDGTRQPTLYGLSWLEWYDGAPAPHNWLPITTDTQAKEILAALKAHRQTSRFKSAKLSGNLKTKWGGNAGEIQNPTSSLWAGHSDAAMGGSERTPPLIAMGGSERPPPICRYGRVRELSK